LLISIVVSFGPKLNSTTETVVDKRYFAVALVIIQAGQLLMR